MKSIFWKTVVVCLVLHNAWCSAAGLPGNPLGPWEASLVRPGQPRAAVYGGGTFVVVGEDGLILSSPDGVSWQDCRSGTLQRLNAVTYGAGKFVAVGGQSGVGANVVLVSTNGVNWTPSIAGVANWLNAVAYGNGRFVAAGREVITSPDGVNWTPQKLNNPSDLTSEITALAYGNGIFAALGYSVGTTSPDGVNWSPLKPRPGNRFEQVVFGNGSFVAVDGSIRSYRSGDGEAWSVHQVLPGASSAFYFVGIGFGNGVFFSSGLLFFSFDGMTWHEGARTFRQARGLAYGNGLYVSAGEDGGVASSPDGLTWTNHRSGAIEQLAGVAAGPRATVAVGVETAYSTVDGTNWSAAPLPPLVRLAEVVPDGNGFLAVGTTNGILQGAVLESPDGLIWRTLLTTPVGSPLYAAAVGKDARVVVGKGGVIFSSINGADWVQRNSPSPFDLISVIYAGGLFVAVGGPSSFNQSVLLTSPDGINWTSREIGPGNILVGVTWQHGTFVALRWYGPYLTSTNGAVWTAHDLGGTPRADSTVTYSSLRGVSAVDGWFFSWNSSGRGWVSADLQQWTPFDFATGKMAGRDGRVFMIDGRRKVWRAPLTGPPYEISVRSQPFASESGELGGFTIRRVGPGGIDLPVTYTLGGTAENGVDYEPLAETVVIPAGAETALVAVRPRTDALADPSETVILTLRPNAAYTVSGQEFSAIVRIDDTSHFARLAPTRIRRLADGSVTLSLELPAGQVFQLEASSDLRTWQALQTITSSGDVHDNTALSAGQRFYRLRGN